jgi:hypothetical protein
MSLAAESAAATGLARSSRREVSRPSSTRHPAVVIAIIGITTNFPNAMMAITTKKLV